MDIVPPGNLLLFSSKLQAADYNDEKRKIILWIHGFPHLKSSTCIARSAKLSAYAAGAHLVAVIYTLDFSP